MSAAFGVASVYCMVYDHNIGSNSIQFLFLSMGRASVTAVTLPIKGTCMYSPFLATYVDRILAGDLEEYLL